MGLSVLINRSEPMKTDTSPQRGGGSQPIYVPALDGVRGLAIALVLLHHFSPTFRPTSATMQAVYYGIKMCWTGVDLFFVLSGFLITRILLATKGQATWLGRFYMRRVLRIFPLYFAAVGFIVFLLPRLAKLDAATVDMIRVRGWYLFAYLQNAVDAWLGQWSFSTSQLNIDHFWSLAVEEQFYLVWPLAVWLLPRRALAFLAIAMCVFAPALRLLLLAAGAPPLVAFVSTPCRMDTMALGALIAMAEATPFTKEDTARYLRYLQRLGVFSLASFVVGAGWTRMLLPTMPFAAGIGFSLLSCASAALLATIVVSPGRIITAIFTSRPLKSLGSYSYGIYILHFPLIFPLARVVHAESWPQRLHSELAAWLIWFLFGTGVSLALAMVVQRVIERPALSLKRFF